jgi:GNAT superfamily N-acetyltransferase
VSSPARDPTIQFEPARPEHADVFISMMRALEATDAGETPFDEPRRRLIFDAFVRDATYGLAWLIVCGEENIGYVVLTVSFSFEYRGYDAFIDELYISEDWRGRGIGRSAMEFVELAARDLGVNAMHLEVSRGNEPAIEVYRRTGYTDNGRYLMTKWLDQKDR